MLVSPACNASTVKFPSYDSMEGINLCLGSSVMTRGWEERLAKYLNSKLAGWWKSAKMEEIIQCQLKRVLSTNLLEKPQN